MNHWSHHNWTLQGVPRIASSSTMCNFLLNISSYSIALNLIFTVYTFSLIIPNCLSSLPQMKSMPSQVRSHHWPKNQEAHLKGALAFYKAATHRCPLNVCLPIFFPYTSWIRSWMTTVLNFIIEAGWWYQSRDLWWQKWRPPRVNFIIWHWRRWFGPPTGGPPSRPGLPAELIRNINGSTAKETVHCRYCYCMPSASKFPRSSCGNVTTTTQTPKVNPLLHVIWVWPYTIHPVAAAMHV